MKEIILNLVQKVSGLLLGEKDPLGSGEKMLDNSVLLEKARLEWQAAQSLFDNVCEDKQIDQAIFHLNAVEKRYGYLLGEVRREHWLNRKIGNNEQRRCE